MCGRELHQSVLRIFLLLSDMTSCDIARLDDTPQDKRLYKAGRKEQEDAKHRLMELSTAHDLTRP